MKIQRFNESKNYSKYYKVTIHDSFIVSENDIKETGTYNELDPKENTESERLDYGLEEYIYEHIGEISKNVEICNVDGKVFKNNEEFEKWSELQKNIDNYNI